MHKRKLISKIESHFPANSLLVLREFMLKTLAMPREKLAKNDKFNKFHCKIPIIREIVIKYEDALGGEENH